MPSYPRTSPANEVICHEITTCIKAQSKPRSAAKRVKVRSAGSFRIVLKMHGFRGTIPIFRNRAKIQNTVDRKESLKRR